MVKFIVRDTVQLTTFEAPLLEAISELLILDNQSLTTEVGDAFEVLENAALTALGTQVLRAGYFLIGQEGAGNPQLLTINLPRLSETYALNIIRNPLLVDLDLPSLRWMPGHLEIVACVSLPMCEAEALLADLAAPPGNTLLAGLDPNGMCP